MTVWIVEMRCEHKDGYRWEPTVGVGLNRESGRDQLKEWRRDNPADAFRLVAYNRSYTGFGPVLG